MLSTDERRDYHRVKIEGAPVQVRATDGPEWVAAGLVDLSAGGLSFRVVETDLPEPAAWPVGQRLAVHIEPTITITDPLSVIVAVTDRLDQQGQEGAAILFRCQTLDFLPDSSV